MSSATVKPEVLTGKVAGRRTLHFQTMEDIRTEARRLAALPVTMLGNWSLGQNFQHLANGLNGAIDGVNVRVPLPIRIVARLFRGFVLNRPMRPGFRLPSTAEKLLVPGDTETQAGLAALEAALTRWQTETTRQPHFAFGKLSSEQWEKLQLRHAEMHLSFVVPANAD